MSKSVKKPLQKESNEIYADFTMSRIDRSVRESMTPEQLAAVRNALLGYDGHRRHSLDIRFSFSLFFARFYFVMLGGRDRRRQTYLQELRRKHKGDVPLFLLMSVLLLSLLLLFFWGAFLGVAYLTKSEMGVDLFENFHLMGLFGKE
jgi:hypothetical protein